MIEYKDIIGAVNDVLSSTGKKVNSRDVSEGFNRPSFFVQLDDIVRSNLGSQVGTSLTVWIYYFPSNRYEYAVEVLEVQEQIGFLFDMKLKVKERYLYVGKFTSFVNDGVLNMSFELEFEDGRYEREFVDDNEQYPIEKIKHLGIEYKEE